MSQPVSIVENEGAEETAEGERDVFAFSACDCYISTSRAVS